MAECSSQTDATSLQASDAPFFSREEAISGEAPISRSLFVYLFVCFHSQTDTKVPNSSASSRRFNSVLLQDASPCRLRCNVKIVPALAEFRNRWRMSAGQSARQTRACQASRLPSCTSLVGTRTPLLGKLRAQMKCNPKSVDCSSHEDCFQFLTLITRALRHCIRSKYFTFSCGRWLRINLCKKSPSEQGRVNVSRSMMDLTCRNMHAS